jgi:hypothetical protein
MFRPSPPSHWDAFALFYPLIQSPGSSSAARFTTTTASSANPLPITVTSLRRLGVRCRSYRRPGTNGPSPGKITGFPCPPTSFTLSALRKGYRASVVEGTSPTDKACQRFAPSLGGNFGSGFLQIPHWLPLDRLFPPRAAGRSFFGHPCLHLHVTSFLVRVWTSTS